jgi:glycosyltransferase involved in cell wall biosynthesis
MTLRTLLVGPRGHGGEGVYMDSLYRDPPDGVRYALSDEFHHGADGANCPVIHELLLNQLIHRVTIPDMGFRALRLRPGRFDLVHVHAHPIFLGGARNTPVVMSEGSSSAVYLGAYLGWDDDRLVDGYRRARAVYRLLRIRDRLLALERVTRAYVFSHWARQVNIRWGADPAKLEVIYPGFPTPPRVDRATDGRFTFLFVGGDFERKGGFELVQAFARIARDFPSTRLWIVGSDPRRRNPDREIHSWVPETRRREALGLMEELHRKGRLVRDDWVDQERLRHEVFLRADAFIMPSHAEGFGFTNVEAMSFGVPVITSTVGPAREIVSDGETGMLVAPGSVDALADAMARLAGDPERARLMGSRAREQFESRFTSVRFRQALGAFYRRALEA